MLVFFTNLTLMGSQVRYLVLFLLFSVIDGFQSFWMGSLHKNIQLMLEFLKAPFLALLLYINGLPDDVICNIAIYADDNTLWFWVWSGIWYVAATRIDFWTWIWFLRHCGLGQEAACWVQCWKNSTGFFWMVKYNTGAIDVKVVGSVLEEKSPVEMLGWLSLLDWIEAITSSLLLKLLLSKLDPWFVLWSFFFLRLLCIFINLSYVHAWNTVVMSGLVRLVAIWNC